VEQEPTWLYNKWGVLQDYILVLLYCLFLLPYLWGWLKVYRSIKADLISVTRYLLLALITALSLLVYNFLLLGINALIEAILPHFTNVPFVIYYVAQLYAVFMLVVLVPLLVFAYLIKFIGSFF
jgi:hypothetical protein